MNTNTTTDIRDIKGLVPLPGWPWWVWALIALMVVGLLVRVWWWARRQPAEEPPLPPVLLSPDEVALRALGRLWDERPEVEVFYTRLSDIIRRYLEDRFALRAPERTTEEFLYEISQKSGASFQLASPEPPAASGMLAPPDLSQAHRQLLGDFLQEADLVKFARFRPGAPEMKRAYDAAEKFVKETGPGGVVAAVSAAAAPLGTSPPGTAASTPR